MATQLTTHLTDTNSIPILSTHPHPSSPALISLSSAFILAHDTASRMGLGNPLRVTITTTAATAVIQTATIAEDAMSGGGGGSSGAGNNAEELRRRGGDMLVGTVVAPVDRMAEARIASWGVEEVARRFQKKAGEV